MLLQCMELRRKWLFAPAVGPEQRRVRRAWRCVFFFVGWRGCCGAVWVACAAAVAAAAVWVLRLSSRLHQKTRSPRQRARTTINTPHKHTPLPQTQTTTTTRRQRRSKHKHHHQQQQKNTARARGRRAVGHRSGAVQVAAAAQEQPPLRDGRRRRARVGGRGRDGAAVGGAGLARVFGCVRLRERACLWGGRVWCGKRATKLHHQPSPPSTNNINHQSPSTTSTINNINNINHLNHHHTTYSSPAAPPTSSPT